jgi:hypothetical protein
MRSARCLLVLSIALLSCDEDPSFRTLRFQGRFVPPLPVKLASSAIELPEGTAIHTWVRAEDDEGKEMGTLAETSFDSEDTSVLLALRMPGPEAGQAGDLILVAIAPGSTRLRVGVKSRHVIDIPVTITPQP